MNRETFRRELLSLGRSWLFIMLFFFLINFLVLSYMNLKGFLFWFDFVCFLGTAVFIGWLDIMKYKIIEGKL